MPSLRGRRARVQDLIDRLRTIPEGGVSAAHFVTEELPALLGYDFGLAYRVDRSSDGWKLGFLELAGYPDTETFRTALVDYLASAPLQFALYSPDQPEPEQRNRVMQPKALVDRTTWLRCPINRDFLAPLGLETLDQLRLLVCDGPLLMAWVGGFRERPFVAHEEALLALLQPALAARFRLERQILDSRLYWGCVVTTLDAITAPALLLVAGKIEHMNRVARVLVDHDRCSVDRILDRSGGRVVSRAKIEIAGLPSAELCILHEPRPDLHRRLADANVTWRLTPAESCVLRYLVLGDANKTIAAKLAYAEVTVEYYVTRLLRKTGTSGRAELMLRFWTAN